jgi:hypothetical protein
MVMGRRGTDAFELLHTDTNLGSATIILELGILAGLRHVA